MEIKVKDTEQKTKLEEDEVKRAIKFKYKEPEKEEFEEELEEETQIQQQLTRIQEVNGSVIIRLG